MLSHSAQVWKAISIPFGIEAVGDYAFFGCSALKKVEFAGSVRKIGECAFALCEKLERLSSLIPLAG